MNFVPSEKFFRLFKACFDESAGVLRDYFDINVIDKKYFNSFIRFLDENKHDIYHEWQSSTPCCFCSNFVRKPKTLEKKIFGRLFEIRDEVRCNRKRKGVNGVALSYCFCKVIAVQPLTLEELDITVLSYLLRFSGITNDDTQAIAEIRNNLAHQKSTCAMTNNQYETMWVKLEKVTFTLAEKISAGYAKPIQRHLRKIRQTDIGKEEMLRLAQEFDQIRMEEPNNNQKMTKEELKLEFKTCTDSLTKTIEDGHQQLLCELKIVQEMLGKYDRTDNNLTTETTIMASKQELQNVSRCTDKTDVGVQVDFNDLNEEETISRLKSGKENERPGRLHLKDAIQHCILLDMTADPEIFQNKETFKFAIDELIDRIIDAGEIDTNQKKTMKITLTFKSPLGADEKKVVRSMLSKYGQLLVTDDSDCMKNTGENEKSFASCSTEVCENFSDKEAIGCHTPSSDLTVKTFHSLSRNSDGNKKPLLLQNGIYLDMVAGPEIFESTEKFKSAIDDLIDRIIDTGNIDTSQNKKMNITLTLRSPLSNEQRQVVCDMLSKYGKLNVSDASKNNKNTILGTAPDSDSSQKTACRTSNMHKNTGQKPEDDQISKQVNCRFNGGKNLLQSPNYLGIRRKDDGKDFGGAVTERKTTAGQTALKLAKDTSVVGQDKYDVTDDDLSLHIDKDKFQYMAEVLFTEIESMNLSSVFLNPVWANSSFVDAFIDVLERNPYITLKKMFLSDQELNFSVSHLPFLRDCKIKVLITNLLGQRFVNRETTRVIRWIVFFGQYRILETIVDIVRDQNEIQEIFRSNIYEKACLLILACLSNSVETVEILLQIVEKECIRICTPFFDSSQITNSVHAACYIGNLDIFKRLTGTLGRYPFEKGRGESLLCIASKNDSVEVAIYIIHMGANVNKGDKDGQTPLHYAVKNGSIEVVKCLTDRGANVNKGDNDGQTPLHCAVENGSIEVVKCLTDRGANVNKGDKDGQKPLHCAAENGSFEVVKCLTERGADVNSKNKYGRTPLHCMSRNGSIEVVKYLLERGEDVNQEDVYGRTPLHYASNNRSIEVAKYLIDKGANVNNEDNDGNTPLHNASRTGSFEVAKYLIDKGADVNYEDSDGNTPLHDASRTGSFEIVEYLIENGADLHKKKRNGETSLHCAAQNGRREIVTYLIENGSNVNEEKRDGKSPIHCAAENGSIEVVKFLIEKGANVNKEKRDGQTPLHCALAKGYSTVVQYLKEIDSQKLLNLTELENSFVFKCLIGADVNNQGANVDKEDMVGKRARHYAAETDNDDLASCLTVRRTHLHCAATKHKTKVVKNLVDKETNINKVERYDELPLHCAEHYGRTKVVENLKEREANVYENDIKHGNP